MIRNSSFLIVLTFLFLVYFVLPKDVAQAGCIPPVKIVGDSYTPTSIQDAYDHASFTLNLTNFTLRLAGEIITENIFLDGGSVVFDGGYDCSFTTKTSTPSSILGTIIISGGAANFAGDTTVVSTDQCSFDRDLDNFTAFGSCDGSADDCNDNDPNINPGAVEICDGLDNNCDGHIDEGLVGIDSDQDGYSAIGSCGSNNDCNDADASIHPDALDIPYDGIDQDCNGADLTFAGETCNGCHWLPTIANYHDLTTPPDGTCVSCHAAQVGNVLAGHYGKTVRTAGNNMNAGDKITCTACHDQSEPVHAGGGIGANGNGSDFVTNKLYPAWDTIPPSITCDTCHEDRAAAHAAAHDHRKITTLCSSCHTSDTTVKGQPGSGTLTSQADIDALHRSDCTLCHGYTGTNLDSAVVAQSIRNGIAGTDIFCLTCHTNFETVHAFLDNHNSLVQVGTTSCGNCHSDPPPLVDANDPKVHSTCSNCHDSEYNRISLAAGKSFAVGGDCKTCHTDTFYTIHPPTVDHSALVRVGTTGCGNCHNDPLPLVDSLDPKVHNACSTCHDSDGGLISLAAGKTLAAGGDCTTCHVDSFDTIHPDTIDHSALIKVETTSCGNCHSDPPPLVDPSDPKVHNACTTCHDAEGRLINDAAGKSFASPGNCTTCHTEPFYAVHPDTIDHSALIKVGSTSCGNCHSDPPPLVDPVDPKVHSYCTTCHDSQGGLISLAAGKSFDNPGDCTTCHTDTFYAIHPADIDHSALVKVGTTGCGSCHSDPPPLVDSGDPKVHNACSTCHDSGGALINDAAGKSFSSPGDCTTCHTNSFASIHPATIDHSALIKVENTSCGNCHDNPPPLVDASNPKVHNGCSTCHGTQGTLVSLAAGKSFASPGNCTTCHTDQFTTIHPDTVDHSQAIQLSNNCSGCHQGPPPLINPDDPKVHDDCTTCHDANGGLINLASGNNAPNECITCHGSDLSTLHPSSSATHVATPGSQDVLVFAAGQHDSSMVGDGTVFMACNTCHDTSNLGNIHDNNCATCHSGSPSPYDTLGGFWAGGCQQGACHATYHADVTDKHNEVTDYAGESNCTYCHGEGWNDFPPLPTSCSNCHATNYVGDTVAPVTTSDIQASSVLVPAVINYTITDNGGKVGLGTTYSRLDGGQPDVGTSFLVETAGSHTLEFWTVDQAGNEELPHNIVNFTGISDTTPPVTTSNASSDYVNAANITLTATDNNPVGIITTYYILNGSPVQTGNSIHVPELNGNFSYSLEYWSVDGAGNEETHHTVNFTIHGGTATLRLVWGDSDTSGSPCSGYPAKIKWEIHRGSTLVSSGQSECGVGGWAGVNDIDVPVSLTPYYVDIWWWEIADGGYYEISEFPNVEASTHGEVVRISY